MKYALFADKVNPTHILLVRNAWVVNGGYRVLYDNKDRSVRLSTREHGKEPTDVRFYWVKDIDPSDKRHYNDVIHEYLEGLNK